MKKLYVMMVMCACALTALGQQASSQQTLGDVARANRAKKHSSSSAVKLDDDTMPRSSTPASEPETAAKADDKPEDAKGNSPCFLVYFACSVGHF